MAFFAFVYDVLQLYKLQFASNMRFYVKDQMKIARRNLQVNLTRNCRAYVRQNERNNRNNVGTQ